MMKTYSLQTGLDGINLGLAAGRVRRNDRHPTGHSHQLVSRATAGAISSA
jgi:hypothetical protein